MKKIGLPEEQHFFKRELFMGKTFVVLDHKISFVRTLIKIFFKKKMKFKLKKNILSLWFLS